MKFARLKQYATNVALALSIVFSFGVGMPATAMAATPMDGMAHEKTTAINCIDQHHITLGTTEKASLDQLENEDDETNPKPLSYFVQFQTSFIEQRQAAPKDIARSSSFHPPDIIRLTSNIRF